MSTVEVSASHAQSAGLQLQVETPENVVLGYELAGPAVRCAAYLVDSAVRGGIVLIVAITLGCTGVATGLTGISQGMILLLLFFMEWVYFIVLEGFFNGRTLGKRAFGLRVITKRGQPISFQAAILRNLLRAVDSQPYFFYGPGFLSMMFSKDLERIGDLAAGTVVVRERTANVPRDPVILERIKPLERDQINSFTPDPRLLAVIDDFLSRRSTMSHERGHAVAAILADQLAERMDFRGDDELVEEYPMAFLARVHVTFTRDDDADEQLGESEGRGRTRSQKSRRRSRRRRDYDIDDDDDLDDDEFDDDEEDYDDDDDRFVDRDEYGLDDPFDEDDDLMETEMERRRRRRNRRRRRSL